MNKSLSAILMLLFLITAAGAFPLFSLPSQTIGQLAAFVYSSENLTTSESGTVERSEHYISDVSLPLQNNSYHSLAGGNFSQNWTNTSLITTADDWSGVASIVGYNGEGLSSSTATDPQTVLAPGTVIDVIPQSVPTSSTGGVHEIESPIETIAIQGSGTADAPHIVLHLDTTGRQNVIVSYFLVETDAATANQRFAIQYRIGEVGNFINIPNSATCNGAVVDLFTASNNQSLNVSCTLPSLVDNQAQVQVRIITNDAVGSDGMIGVDDLGVSSTPIVNVCDFCNLQFPSSFTVSSGATSDQIFGQIFEAGVTEAPGAGAGITAEVGYGPQGSDPHGNGSWTWSAAGFNTQVGNNDEYVGTFTAPAPGTYSYTYRYSFDGGTNWTYGDLDGNGTNPGLSFSTAQLGTMTVNASGAPGIMVGPTTLNFGNQNVGSTSSSQSVTVTNTGTANLVLGTPTFATGTQFAFTSDPNGTTVTPGDSTVISFTFTPTTAGAKNDTVSVNSNASGAAPTVALSGTGVSPDINVTPASINFGNQTVGTNSSQQTVTIQNTGNAALTVSDIAFTGGNPGDFTFTGITLPASIPAGNQAQFGVTFSPSATSTRNTTMVITSSDADEPTTNISLSGTGVAPEIDVEGNGLDIADDDASPSTADGTDFGSVSVEAFSKATAAKRDMEFLSGSAVAVNSTGTPEAGSSFDLSTSITDGATAEIPGTSITYTITVSNAGPNAAAGAPTVTFSPLVNGVTWTCSGTNGASCPASGTGNISSGNGNFILPAGSSVTYIATGTISPAAAGTLSSTASASLVGDTDEANDFATDEDTLSTTPGRTFVIRNTGTANLNLTGTPRVSIGGTHASDFAVVAQPSTPVAPNGSVSFDVTFDPSGPGLRAAEISIANDDPDENPYNFSIQGNGVAPDISVEDPTSNVLTDNSGTVDLGTETVGIAGSAKTFTVRNVGTGTLNVNTTITVTGTNASDFVVDNTGMSPVLGPGGNTAFTVTFDPTGSGPRSAQLQISSDDPDEAIFEVNLTGTGEAAPSPTPTPTVTPSPTPGGASIVVDSLADNTTTDGECTLREAISAANTDTGGDCAAGTGNDSITFAPGLFSLSERGTELVPQSIVLAGSELAITQNVNIDGPGAGLLTIDGGAGSNRVFGIYNPTVSISELTITGGNGSGAGTDGYGGAVFASGSLTLDGVHVTSNAAVGGAGGLFLTNGTSEIRNSTISGNSAPAGCGALYNFLANELTIQNSTISGNSTTGSVGGGICNAGAGAVLTILNSTITNNSAGSSGGGIYSDSGAALSIGSTIIAGNNAPTGVEIYFGTGSATSLGFNLVGDLAGDAGNTQNAITYQSSDILDTPPQLGLLQHNGGTTPTHMPAFFFPGHDKGCAFGATTDQRGFGRTIDWPGVENGTCTGLEGTVAGLATDIGAVELLVATAAPVSISGQALDTAGRGIAGATVAVVDMNGNVVRQTRTNTFGYFVVFEVPAGSNYIIMISAKRYRFQQSSLALSLHDSVDGLQFVGRTAWSQ